MRGMDRDFDIVVAGGGLNGPALALALADAGLSVAVVDARPADARAGDAFDGRAYALALASQRLFAALGLWPALQDQAQVIRRVQATRVSPAAAPARSACISTAPKSKRAGWAICLRTGFSIARCWRRWRGA